MKIELVRDTFNANETLGKLYIDGEYFCETIEDFDRSLYEDTTLEEVKKIKVYGQTAIPYGTYEVVVSYSQKFKKFLPLLLNVTGFLGIRIHSGNKAIHSLGCILVGDTRTTDSVLNSIKTMSKLMPKILKAAKKEKIFLTITKLRTA